MRHRKKIEEKQELLEAKQNIGRIDLLSSTKDDQYYFNKENNLLIRLFFSFRVLLKNRMKTKERY